MPLMTPRCHKQRLSAPYYYLLSYLLLICTNWAWCVGVLAALGKLNDHGRDTAWMLSKVQTALQVSKLSTSNITAAHEACRQWDEILLLGDDPLENFPTLLLDDNVLALCRAFHASTLVRVGQDEKAIRAYDSALDLQEFLDPKTKDDLIIGKAQALQRLLKYSDAKSQYLRSRTERGAVGAAICALRIGEAAAAKSIVSEFCGSYGTEKNLSARGMMGTLIYLETGTLELSLPLLEGANALLLYRWIYASLRQPGRVRSTAELQEDPFIELLKINLCPFDDGLLVRLDDKIHLHELLTTGKGSSNTRDFWPEGYILPQEKTQLHAVANNYSPTDSFWISKQRAGYGSHGNQLLTMQQALQKVGTDDDDYLLQRMIEPALLLDGRKFSLRVYVIYFSPDEVYLSSEGLVKMAAMPMIEDSRTMDSRVHMTNSGREATMLQNDLTYLKANFDKAGYSYDAFWSRIRSSIVTVFEAYEGAVQAKDPRLLLWDSRREQMGIPKIMGFDYVVDGSCQPWLVEVNRFPGLEPRDDSDRPVKYQVLRDAWICAAQRLEMTPHPLQDILDELGCESVPSSLERL
jgi:hypothetical protein